jgi:hypothetical protein
MMMLAFQVCEKQYSLNQLNIKKLGSCFWERNQDWKNMESDSIFFRIFEI